jgi:hypothetical protein
MDDGVVSGERDTSVFLRIDTSRGGPRRVGNLIEVASLIEVDLDGYIPREVGVTADAVPTYVTRSGEYGVFNDSALPRIAPGSAEFDKQWAFAERITREDFERVYEPAAAELPETIGGSPLWQSDLAAAGCLLALLVLALGFVVAVLQLTGVLHLLG